ncbi:MAG: APC family permease [Anaerovoracaceae bacterium]|jgi:amino acid transporter|nr:APC family permease [Anaerovoracaceae bacterium]
MTEDKTRDIMRKYQLKQLSEIKLKGVFMSESSGLKRSIGLLPGLAILVGFVVGASIFVVPGELAAEIGPAVWLAYLIAGGLALTVCFVYAQIGSIIPASGANYIFCTYTLGGYGGFLYMTFYLFVIVFLCPAMALGIGNYLVVFIPQLNIMLTAVMAMVVTGIINLLPTSFSSKIQTLAFAFVLLVVVLFGTGGIMNANWSNFVPMFPYGVGPVVATVLTCYFSFTGFNALTEMSGEIKDPGKNIPRIVFLGFTVIMLLYGGVCVGLVALIPAPELGVGAPMVLAAGQVFSGEWFGSALAIAAILGAWTSLNISIMSLSRDLYTLGKTRILPRLFTKTNKSMTPYIAVVVATIIGVGTILVSQEIMGFINMSSVFFMLVAIIVSVGSLRIKIMLPDRYENAEYKLRGIWYYVWPVLAIGTTGYFLVDFLLKNQKDALFTIISVAVAVGIYYLRKKSLIKNNIDIQKLLTEMLTGIDKDEEEEHEKEKEEDAAKGR